MDNYSAGAVYGALWLIGLLGLFTLAGCLGTIMHLVSLLGACR